MHVATQIPPADKRESIAAPPLRRGMYDEIRRKDVPQATKDLLEEVLDAICVEEQCTSTNRRGGFDAWNVDVYGFDVSRDLIAIQIRHTWREKESRWTEQKKWYALCGRDEGQVFCHVLRTSFRQCRYIDDMSPEDLVRWAECKIFRVPMQRLDTIIRQGDVALVPVRAIPRFAERLDDTSITLRDSHEVEVDGVIYEDPESERIWAEGLIQIGHEPGQHKPIDADGRFEIVVGERLDVDFSTID